jgi:type II secretory pathway component PulJ
MIYNENMKKNSRRQSPFFAFSRKSPPSRKGFTVLETLIAITLASLIIVVIMNTMISNRYIIEKNMRTLEFLQESTIFLEYVKRDIRNASRTEGSVSALGDELTILTEDINGKRTEIQYKYKRDKNYVGRREGSDGKVKWFGRIGSTGGIIVDFTVKAASEDPAYTGFYLIRVEFMSRSDYYQQKNQGVTTPKARRTHVFQSLINRRTPSSVDDKWNSAFRQ